MRKMRENHAGDGQAFSKLESMELHYYAQYVFVCRTHIYIRLAFARLYSITSPEQLEASRHRVLKDPKVIVFPAGGPQLGFVGGAIPVEDVLATVGVVEVLESVILSCRPRTGIDLVDEIPGCAFHQAIVARIFPCGGEENEDESSIEGFETKAIATQRGRLGCHRRRDWLVCDRVLDARNNG